MSVVEIQTSTLDLRSGHSIWEKGRRQPGTFGSLAKLPHRADIVIVGGGITGSFLAERLTRSGRSVLVVDRHRPAMASTAASTALLQWEIDTPLVELEALLGFEKAASIYRRSLDSVATIGAIVAAGGVAADFEPRESLYLSGNRLDPVQMREEMRLREHAGLPSVLLDADQLGEHFGFDRQAAILSQGSAQANPIALAQGLMALACERGAHLLHSAQVTAYDFSFKGAAVMIDDEHEIAAEIVILANGFEMPAFLPSRRHNIVSTWALATVPQKPSVLWPRQALVWEASEPYGYMRTDPLGRIIIGGEDEDITDADERDRRTPEKAATLLRNLTTLLPAAQPEIETAWSGFFGETDDGLPLVGPVPGCPRCYAAFGYGGNGITFSAMAAEMIGMGLAGDTKAFEPAFAIDR